MTSIDTKFFFLINLLFCVIVFFFGEIIYSNFLSQLFIFIIPLIWPGLAHGSLDILTAKKKKNNKRFFDFLIFLMIYLLIPIFFFLLWQIYPNYIFTVFLVLSLMHFGISDKLNKDNSTVFNEIFLRSMIIICMPIMFHNEQTLQIFYFLGVSLDYCRTFSEFIKYFSLLLVPVSMFYFSQSLKKKEYGQVFDIMILFFCFIFYQPLLSFLIYFCFLHSIRHLLNEKRLLKLSNKNLFLKTVPMTVIVLFFIIVLIFSYFYFPDTIIYFFISISVIAIFCLTISHVLLINFIKEK